MYSHVRMIIKGYAAADNISRYCERCARYLYAAFAYPQHCAALEYADIAGVRYIGRCSSCINTGDCYSVVERMSARIFGIAFITA